MSTKKVSGPAKQLFQLIKHANSSEFQWIISDTDEKCNSWEFKDEAIKRGISFITLRESMRYDPSPIWQTYKIIKENNIHMIQSHGYKTNVIALILKMLTGLPWISFVHGWTAEDAKIKLYNKIDGYLLRFPDMVITVSDSYRNRLIEMGIQPEKVVTIHNAIDPEEHITLNEDIRGQLDLSKDKFVIGVIGRLSPEKGQRIFLDAFKEIKTSIPGVKALIIGDGPDIKSLKNYSQSLGFDGTVKFLGHCADILPFYRAIDLLVIPSFSEGLPNVLLEAMYCGKPVVATSVGGIPEVVVNNHSGVLVRQGDSKALASGVIATLSDKGKKAYLAKNGKEVIMKRFLPGSRVEKILSIYKTLLRQ
ncbi:MAG: glycosyltransferase [Candidatus Scalindua rubra]|uniref:Glycosyltransferase n=1 Tax=Candidatus Scalindua rubra TaxID=1872076 RepID=A0A1E3XC71_9BACT|nr:MAG: glycosyltransferase [Candidatus Scalindua rubra]